MKASRMRFLVIALVCLAVVGWLCQAAVSGPLTAEWIAYKLEHGKSYASQAEDANRMANFLATKQQIERHNDHGSSSYKMGLNHMSDWTQEELAKLVAVKPGLGTLLDAQASANLTKNDAFLDDAMVDSTGIGGDGFDWRTVPERVGPVKDQGQCASGYAFAATGTLEGQLYQSGSTKGKLVPLSEQELVDCAYSCVGCDGGSAWSAFWDIHLIGGLETQSDYPYEASVGRCRLQSNKTVITTGGWRGLPSKNEVVLAKKLVGFGPIPARFHVTDALTKYKSGVFVDNNCFSDLHTLNHDVLLVGYGTDPKEGDYWIVKNSWSAKWGEQGYFRVKRGINMCGIATFPTVPIF